MIRKQKRLGSLMVLMLGLTACADGRTNATPMSVSETSPVVISETSASSYGGGEVSTGGHHTVSEPMADLVSAEVNSSVMTVNIGGTLQERPLTKGDDLPAKINIPPSTLHDVPVTSALQAVLAGTNIPLSWNGPVGDRPVTVENFSGTLPAVVDKFCTIADVFCSYHNGTLELQAEETFVVNLPGQNKNNQIATVIGNGLLNVLNRNAGNKVQVDPQGESLLYTANVDNQDKARSYFEQLRNGRPLIAMQLYVWDVALDEANREGINWNAMRAGQKTLKTPRANLSPSLEPKDETASGVSLNAIALDRANITSLAEFLSTQGRLKTIDNSEIVFAADATPPVATGQIKTNDTAKNYGAQFFNQGKDVDIGVGGAYDKGFVIADLHLSLKGDHPDNMNVDTIIHVHPGENLVLAGVITPSSSEGVLRKQDDKAHEIVVVIKPTVYLFANAPVVASVRTPPPPSLPPPVKAVIHQQSASESEWPDPVVIDKDGVKPLMDLPASPILSVPTQSTIDPNVPAAVIYNSTNASVLENLSIPYPPDYHGDGL